MKSTATKYLLILVAIIAWAGPASAAVGVAGNDRGLGTCLVSAEATEHSVTVYAGARTVVTDAVVVHNTCDSVEALSVGLESVTGDTDLVVIESWVRVGDEVLALGTDATTIVVEAGDRLAIDLGAATDASATATTAITARWYLTPANS